MKLLRLLILPLGIACQDVPCEFGGEDHCGFAEAAEISVQLFQHSLSIVPTDHSSASVVKAQELANAPRTETDQLIAELKSVRKARQDALASLRILDGHVLALETRLSASKQGRHAGDDDATMLFFSAVADVHETFPYSKNFALLVFFVLDLFYMWQTISKHEGDRNELHDVPWYYESETMLRVLSGVAIIWTLSGVVMFTEIMLFTDKEVHLSVIEAIYVMTQIITTVGYGDHTPSTNAGKVIMAFFAFTGVAVIAACVQQWLLKIMAADEAPKQPGRQWLGKHHESIMSVLPLLLCMAFGTAFFSLYPGEDKSSFEALYMSVISLLTIGFGVYHPLTQVGKLVGSMWLIIGVAYMGSAIVSFTDMLFKERQCAISKAAAFKLFTEIDLDHSGTIDKLEFVGFYLVQNGMPRRTVEDAHATFDSFDADGNGVLSFEEFSTYVDAIGTTPTPKKACP